MIILLMTWENVQKKVSYGKDNHKIHVFYENQKGEVGKQNDQVVF